MSILIVILLPTVVTAVTGSLEASDCSPLVPVDHLLYSIRNLTLRDTGNIRVDEDAHLIELMMEVQSVIGIALVGLFGFVLGNVVRNR